MSKTYKLKNRFFYYAVIGSLSALTHITLVFVLVNYGQLPALIANIFAFFTAFNVSYLGHKHWTFAKMQNQKVLSLPHFFLVAASAGAINELLYFLVLRVTHLNYLIALVLVLILVSIYSFLLARYWACR